MPSLRILRTGLIVLSGLLLAGCQDEPEPQAERVRAIKPFTVTEPAGSAIRRYSGTIDPSERSNLSFAVSGTVAAVEVNQGDAVSAGQVLASLDTRTFDLDIDAAQSDLASAEAAYEEASLERDRKTELFKKEWVSKAALDSAVAAAQTAGSAVDAARSRLGQAERNLDKTNLLAPFDGTIAERNVDPFTEITAGQSLFTINTQDTLEVAFSVPGPSAGRLSQGQEVQVDIGTVPGCGCTGRITEIGSAAGTANAVSIVAAMAAAPAAVLPGMPAEVLVALANGDDGASGYLVPLNAIAPGASEGTGFVFKFDGDAGVVRKVAVTGSEGRENMVAIQQGVEPGDILAVAGVSFLRDGQPVTLLDQ